MTDSRLAAVAIEVSTQYPSNANEAAIAVEVATQYSSDMVFGAIAIEVITQLRPVQESAQSTLLRLPTLGL